MTLPKTTTIILIPYVFFLVPITGFAEKLNGFELTGAAIPVEEILQGGPPKDGIPAIDAPKFLTADKAMQLREDDYVMGIADKGEAKAFPIRILNWHEVVNDTIGGKPVVITYCPLCGSGVVFEAVLGGRRLSFGVSGLLYNSDVLLYDRETESLWSQLESMAITGDYKGTNLKMIPVLHTTWKNWRALYPQTLVLDFDTGYQRNYKNNPYAGYAQSKSLYFPVKFRAFGFHPKELVVGIEINGEAKAWPFVELRRANQPIKDKVGGTLLVVEFDAENNSVRILDNNGDLLPGIRLFWFAWAGFHPDTKIYRYSP